MRRTTLVHRRYPSLWLHALERPAIRRNLVLMQVCHALFSRWRKQLARDERKHDAKFFRAWNEVPTLLLIVIVVMAVVKPF